MTLHPQPNTSPSNFPLPTLSLSLSSSSLKRRFLLLQQACISLRLLRPPHLIVWMDPSSAQHQQQMPSQSSLENMLASSKAQNNQERKPRPQPEQALKCPRCDSSNTKFCYYNNYSLSQPRYFCKSCRRYWTKGGTLRNVPVGGGCRKNKRSSSSSSSSKRAQDQSLIPNSNSLITTLPPLSYDPNDLTLALARLQKQSCGQFGFDSHDFSVLGNSLGNISSTNTGFLDALRSGFLETQSSSNLQNVYYGYGNGDLGEVENGSNSNNACGITGVSGEIMLPFDQEASNATTQAVTVTTMKQEICNNGREQGDTNKVLWGLPWQLSNGDTNMGEIDSGRANWNSLTSSSWHGLLNSPLM